MTESCPNYLLTTEEHFRSVRGTPLFRLSTLDWALLEAWERAGIPLEAVLRGIDVAFKKWRAQETRARTGMINSLGYCRQAVVAEAESIARQTTSGMVSEEFSIERIRAYISRNVAALRDAGRHDFANSLQGLDLDVLGCDLERLEQHLDRIESSLIAKLREEATEELLTEVHNELKRELRPYRGNMTADQLAMLEQKFLARKLLESARLPRLSLFYL